MIRINLLKGRPGSAGPLADTASRVFLSRREVLLGTAFLLLGGVFLFTQFRDAGNAAEAEQEETLGAVTVPAEASPPADGSVFESASAPSDGVPAVDRLDPAIQPRLPATPSPTVEGPPPAPVKGAGRLTQLFVSRREDSLRIFAATASQPSYRVFRLDHPNRVVIDLPDIVLALPASQRDQSLTHSQVRRLRAAQYRVDPPIARVVLDVSSFPDVEVLPQFNGLYVRVSDKAE